MTDTTDTTDTTDSKQRPCRPGVIERADQILQAVARAQVIGVSELARSTDLAKTTAHRLALDLVDAGLLERSGDAFRLGYRLFELGNQVVTPRNLREAALPLMEHMLQVSGQTVHLAVKRGDEVSYIERIFSHHPSRLPSAVASRLPLHCTATGKCFLAFGCDAHGDTNTLAQMFDDQPGCPDRAERVDPVRAREQLARELDQVRSEGLAFESSEIMPGVTSVAAPVFSFGNVIVAALSVTGFIDDFDPIALGPLLRDASHSLSRSLGASDECSTRAAS